MSLEVDFDELHFIDCTVQNVTIDGKRITLRIKNLAFMRADLLHKVPMSELVFDGVTSSHRTIARYKVSPKIKHMHPEETIVDIEGTATPQSTTYTLEGLLEQPSAWIIEWTISAASFALNPL